MLSGSLWGNSFQNKFGNNRLELKCKGSQNSFLKAFSKANCVNALESYKAKFARNTCRFSFEKLICKPKNDNDWETKTEKFYSRKNL